MWCPFKTPMIGFQTCSLSQRRSRIYAPVLPQKKCDIYTPTTKMMMFLLIQIHPAREKRGRRCPTLRIAAFKSHPSRLDHIFHFRSHDRCIFTSPVRTEELSVNTRLQATSAIAAYQIPSRSQQSAAIDQLLRSSALGGVVSHHHEPMIH